MIFFKGVGKIGPIYLDAYPKIHRKDILAHEVSNTHDVLLFIFFFF
jgi:hypothetical protein